MRPNPRCGTEYWRRPMADPRGFLNVRDRELPARRPVPVRLMDFKEVYARREEDSAALTRQAGRCIDCGIPFCHQGCPLRTLSAARTGRSRTGRGAAAIAGLRAANYFPDSAGRLCAAPCETACVRGIPQPAVTIQHTAQ